MPDTTTPASLPDRRAFLGYFSSIGLGSTLLPGVLLAGDRAPLDELEDDRVPLALVGHGRGRYARAPAWEA